MELTYSDAAGNEIAAIEPSYYDQETGDGGNTFKLTVPNGVHLEEGCRIFSIGTDYGGIVDGLDDTSSDDAVSYTGRTWTGVLAGKVVGPDPGSAYLAVSGEANDVLRFLAARLDLSPLFGVSAKASGIRIDGYTFAKSSETADSGRYCDAYTAMRAMFKANGAKLRIAYRDGQPVLSASKLVDYTTVPEWDGDLVKVRIKRSRPVNHLVCLGSGNLADRTVLHLYADADGRVSTAQTLFGADEIADVYDCPSDDAAKLLSDGKAKLEDCRDASQTVKVSLDAADDDYDIGDIIGGMDPRTGISGSAAIAGKVVRLESGSMKASYS